MLMLGELVALFDIDGLGLIVEIFRWRLVKLARDEKREITYGDEL